MKKIETIDQLHQVETFIYQELVKVCRENHLKLYLQGGTLIGAVRHQGFIPWDDDIDLSMTRPDYEKLLEITGGKIGEKCRLLDPERNMEYKGCIPNVIYENSHAVSKQFKNEDLQISLSIFVLDGVPEGKLKRKFYYTRMYILKAEHALCRADFKHVNTKIARVVGPILSPFFNPKGVYKRRANIIKWQKKYPYETSVNVCPNTDCCPTREIFPREVCEKTAEVMFEGIPSQTFSNYDEQLRSIYGDYMQLPPEDQRIPKHSFDAEIEDSFVLEA